VSEILIRGFFNANVEQEHNHKESTGSSVVNTFNIFRVKMLEGKTATNFTTSYVFKILSLNIKYFTIFLNNLFHFFQIFPCEYHQFILKYEKLTINIFNLTINTNSNLIITIHILDKFITSSDHFYKRQLTF
jgi:hypothetical protein